jgi:histidinol-phosphate aminotransferase
MAPTPRPEVAALSPYRLRREDVPVKLNQNESPLDLPAEVKREIGARLADAPWNRYPPVRAQSLRSALARSSGVGDDRVLVTNGSNESILVLAQAYAAGGVVVAAKPSYSMSRPLAVVAGARVLEVPLGASFELDVDAMLEAAVTNRAAMILVASPNNPTGNRFPNRDLARLARNFGGLVVVDEAYWGYHPESPLALVGEFENVAVVRTGSKAFGLAAARVGWIVASRDVTEILDRAAPPYNVGLFAQIAAEAMAARGDLVAERIAAVLAERERVAGALRALGITVYPSDANFLLLRLHDAATTFQRLLQHGVLVRDVTSYWSLDNCLRVTIGTREENERFLSAMRAAWEVLA